MSVDACIYTGGTQNYNSVSLFSRKRQNKKREESKGIHEDSNNTHIISWLFI